MYYNFLLPKFGFTKGNAMQSGTNGNLQKQPAAYKRQKHLKITGSDKVNF